MSISTSGAVTWSAPSNIALIKYWGKKENQFPCNASLSLTLEQARSDTTLKWNEGRGLSFLFEGKETKFKERVENFLKSLDSIYPFLKEYSLSFESKNSFPHGAGIASSASSMASIALCLESMAEEIVGPSDNFFKKASLVARLGSGSASRSVYGGLVSWGDESIEFASPITKFDGMVKNLKDAILIVDSNEKSISSSEGHRLMIEHPFAELRFDQANINYDKLIESLTSGEFDKIGKVIEAEALSIHSMMMTSTPPYILMRPNTLRIMEEVKNFRVHRNIPVYFTLDAGPNVHLIYEVKNEKNVESWIENELLKNCESWIVDRVGDGPRKVE